MQTDLGVQSSIMDSIRQRSYPPEFRIAAPVLLPRPVASDPAGLRPGAAGPPPYNAAQAGQLAASNQLIGEVATCLWYLKTKHFRRDWEDDDTGDDDPRIRRALGRLHKGIEALKEHGIEVHDPINKRYPPGGAGMMRPIQLQPTAGLTVEMVTETVTPIVYRDSRLIQRGEVFVAVPEVEAASASPPATEISRPDVGNGAAAEAPPPPPEPETRAADTGRESGQSRAAQEGPGPGEDGTGPGQGDSGEGSDPGAKVEDS